MILEHLTIVVVCQKVSMLSKASKVISKGHRNRPIFINEIKSIINNLLKQKAPVPGGFTGELYQILEEEIIPILYNLFQKTKTERILPDTFKGQHYPNTKTRQRHHQENKL